LNHNPPQREEFRLSSSFRRKRSVATIVGLAAVVTPLLDMTFQLLFFFFLNVQPVAQEGQVDVSLLAATSDKRRSTRAGETAGAVL
jgi:biopolymer transport protein ExbD